MRRCSFERCGRRHHARGLCTGHWNQWRVGKDLVPLGNKTKTAGMSTEDRFWFYVDVRDYNGCWLWDGKSRTRPDERAYGVFRIGQQAVLAHRFAYELFTGEIPDGLDIDHVCRRRLCVNPDHLRLATRKQNMEHQAVQPKNTSGYRGVSWEKRRHRWAGKVQHNNRSYFAGYFDTPEAAHSAVVALRNRLFTHNDLDRLAS